MNDEIIEGFDPFPNLDATAPGMPRQRRKTRMKVSEIRAKFLDFFAERGHIAYHEDSAPRLVHRLDRDTSGLLMIAKKRSMLRHLHAALRGDGVDKRYMALVRGHWPTSKKQVNAPLLKSNLRSGERMVEVNDEGKEALTLFRVLRRFGDFATIVEARPITGRTHQIRVHTLHAGHMIAGDSKYGDEDFSREIRELGGKRLFLHAYALTVPLPDGGELKLEAPVDEVWAKTVERLSAS